MAKNGIPIAIGIGMFCPLPLKGILAAIALICPLPEGYALTIASWGIKGQVSFFTTDFTD